MDGSKAIRLQKNRTCQRDKVLFFGFTATSTDKGSLEALQYLLVGVMTGPGCVQPPHLIGNNSTDLFLAAVCGQIET